MKIVYVLHGLAAGGTEAFVLNVVSNLDKEKYDITFILAVDDNGKTHQYHEDYAREMGIEIYRTCDLDSIKKWILHYRKLKELLLQKGPFDIIHCNMDMFNGINLLAAKRVGIPIRICHSHISESQYQTNFMKLCIVRIYRFAMRILIKHNATLMLGCSKSANQYMYGNNKKSIVLYNGIQINKFKRQKTNNTEINKKRIMTVGRMTAPKNPEFIYQVILELSRIRKDFYFQWVGDGTVRKEYEERSQKDHLDQLIQFMGNRNDVNKIMWENQYFLLPSINEGFGIALIEAQAAGLHCFCLLYTSRLYG